MLKSKQQAGVEESKELLWALSLSWDVFLILIDLKYLQLAEKYMTEHGNLER
jgi:hypothetical protein